MKYYEYYNHLSPDEVFEGLLSYGFFGEKLPPCFSSEDFYNFCQSNIQRMIQFKKPEDYITYTVTRNTNVPRNMGLPTPITYFQLCYYIKLYWVDIVQYFESITSGNKHKVSKIHVRKFISGNEIFRMNYKSQDNNDVYKLFPGNRFLVKADISNCFPSMYSHAIPWAAIGREKAKNDRDPNKWYNKIDLHVRNCKFGETVGLLIGPHTSNIISEIILCKIDEKLSSKYDYVRHIDDYSCVVKTSDKADLFLSDLASELKRFNLMINAKKVEVKQLPENSNQNWINALSSYQIKKDDYPLVKINELRAYFDLMMDLVRLNNENTAIINYGLKKLKKYELTPNAKEYYKSLMFSYAIIYPYLLTLYQEYVIDKLALSESEILDLCNLIKDNIDCAIYQDALIYCIYFVLNYKINGFSTDFQSILRSNNPLLMTLAFKNDQMNNNTANIKLYKSQAKSLLASNFDEYWIFCYTVISISNLPAIYREMKQNNVAFVKF